MRKIAGRRYPTVLVWLVELEDKLRLRPKWACNKDKTTCLDIRITPALRLLGLWAEFNHWYVGWRKKRGLNYGDYFWKAWL